jgi:16S rRNA (guanine(527)-N(7))-methyltransferase RsmG
MSISAWAEFELTSEQIAQLERHRELLARWNLKLNLVSALEPRHYLESLFLAKHLPEGWLKIADVGSGAGFPGFPVAVVRPECEVTLIESHQRKSVFLRDVSRETRNVRVLAKRAESVSETFDWAISRAVRYSDIRETMQKLAPNVALLTGDLEIECRERIRLPWGDRRFLVIA